MNPFEENAAVFKAFSDGTRLMILDLLRAGECCAKDLLDDLPVNQSTLSHHMKILCASGVVESYKNGKWTHYSIDHQGVEKARRLLAEITTLKTITLTVEVQPQETILAGGSF